VTVLAPFYMPTIEKVLESVGTACVISKLDLNKRYYQVKVKEEDISKTPLCDIGGNLSFSHAIWVEERSGSLQKADIECVGTV